jgi:hypothetical protein
MRPMSALYTLLLIKDRNQVMSRKSDFEKAIAESNKDTWLEKIPEIKDQPLDKQIGGYHYKGMAIQPIEFAQKNRLNYCESNVIKYICRHADKNGVEDLRKAIHNIELLIQIEYGDD